MAVAAYHTQATFSRHAVGDLAFETYLFKFGAVGVHIFFVISGLVMVITTSGKTFSFPNFLKRRFIRIYPIYWICVILYVGTYALLGEGYTMTRSQWIGAIFLLPGDFPRIIGPGWTLAFEIFFYISFAIAMSFTGLSKKITQEMAIIGLGVVFILSIGLGRAFPGHGSLYWVATNVLLLEFISGAGIGWLIGKNRLPQSAGLPLLIVALLGYAGALFVGYDMTTRFLTMGVASFLLVLGAVSFERRHGVSKRLSWLVKLGDSSYALYLIHVLIVALLIRAANHLGWTNMVAPWVVAVIALPILVFAGHQLHFKLEQPILARLNRRDVAARPERREKEA